MTKKELKQMIREIAYRDVSPWNRGENIPDKYEAPISDGPMKPRSLYSANNHIGPKKEEIQQLIQRLSKAINKLGEDDFETADYVIDLLYQACDATVVFELGDMTR